MMGVRSRAQALVFLTTMLPLFLAVIGLALDGGHLFAERANLQAVADASARAGAVRLDTARIYSEGTSDVFLSRQVRRHHRRHAMPVGVCLHCV